VRFGELLANAMANSTCIHYKNSRALWPLRCYSLRIIPDLEVDVLNHSTHQIDV
jgi:hypothetical protein